MPESRLLILDDDAAVGRTLQTVAELESFTVRTTTYADAFFAEVDAWQPTHIALDLVMPGMDGVQVLARLASQGCRARIIVISGVGERVLDAAARSAAEQGLDIAGILPKPFSTQSFRSLLVNAAIDLATATEEALQPDAHPDQKAAGPPTAAELQEALDQGELSLVYQPKIECASRATAGFEALARWHHPIRGTIPPASFIPLAERSGLIGELTLQVLDQSLTWFSTLPDGLNGGVSTPTATQPITLSVNVSAQTLDDEGLVEKIDDLRVRHGVAPDRMIFELTETSAMRHPTKSLALLARLRMKGYKLSIDDFGTGFSSMVQLVRLPFSEIKVDKSFVMTAPQSEESRAVIRSIVELGNSLGLTCTAEGVEHAETLHYLTDLGAELAQGYYVARPMEGAAAARWARPRPSA